MDPSPPAAEAGHPRLPRHGFVTIGATAGFRPLLDHVLSPELLQWMSAYGFTRIAVQCGSDYEWFRSRLASVDTFGIEVDCFRYTLSMRDCILPCRPVKSVRNAGIVICHAGSGTVIDVSRCGVPFVVVPNESLMDNHQAELASFLEAEQWAVASKPDGLPQAIKRAHDQAYAAGLSPLPVEACMAPEEADEFPIPESERITVLDWMVRSCYEDHLQSGVFAHEQLSKSSQTSTTATAASQKPLPRHPHARPV